MSAPEAKAHPYMRSGRFGAAGAPVVRIANRPLDIVQVAARKNQAQAVVERVQQALGLSLAQAGKATLGGSIQAVWIAPETWLVMRAPSMDHSLAHKLAAELGSTASIAAQTSGKRVFRLSGEKARDVLAKGCRIDLHPRAFRLGQTAVTQISHVGVVLVQAGDVPSYDLIVGSTLAEDFFAWLCDSAAAFGYEVDLCAQVAP